MTMGLESAGIKKNMEGDEDSSGYGPESLDAGKP